MSGPTVLRKRYENHYGLDLKSSALTRPVEFASTMKNAQYRESGAPEKRKGFMAHGNDAGGYGTFTYARKNTSTGADEKECIVVERELYKYLECTLTVSYSGVASAVTVSKYYSDDDAQYKFKITTDTTTALDQNLGLGFDEASPYTVNSLATAINALTGFTASVSGSTSTPAAFLKMVRDYDVKSNSLDLVARYKSQINSTGSNPLNTFYGKRNDDDFENASAVNLANCLYVGTGWDYTMKYDGQTFYRAGLPTPATLTSTLAAGGVTGSNYYHRIQYIQHDNAGNIIEGNLTTVSTGLSPAGQSMDVTVANIVAGTNFNTNCAVVNGAQVAVTTITVDNGSGGDHTLKVGDTAYFYNGVSSAYVTRTVTAVTGTTLTISGAAVNVADNAVISNNLRVALFRNKTSATTPTVFYLVAELPNNSFAATQVYNDNLADSSLGALLTPPLYDRSPPPAGKYVSAWLGCMVVSGEVQYPNLVEISLDGPEYFPVTGENVYSVETLNGDKISGLSPNNEVFAVGLDKSFAVLSGDPTLAQVGVEIKSIDNGVSAHATFQELDGTLVWMSPKGPRWSRSGSVPRPLGEYVNPADGRPTGSSRIDPAFSSAGLSATQVLKLKRAIGVNNTLLQKYILYVPAESAESSQVYANSNSRIFSYDYTRDSWLEWSNMNMAGGATIFGDEFLFVERRYSVFNSTVDSILYRGHDLNDAWDYADNDEPIGGTESDAWHYACGWDHLGEPSVLKKLNQLSVFSVEETANNDYTLLVDQEINLQEGARAEFEIERRGAGYGNSAYGDDPYGDPQSPDSITRVFRENIKSWRFKFKNNEIHQNVILSGWEVEISTSFKPRLIKA